MRDKDWLTRIDEARARGHFLEEDRTDATSWSSCAVGEARKTRMENGLWFRIQNPTLKWSWDIRLVTIGYDFGVVVCHNDFDAAEAIVKEARKRLKVPADPRDDTLVRNTMKEIHRQAVKIPLDEKTPVA